ncbi:MAG: O-antigen ligase family protein [Candidatus Colwellbacteria bacterium]
MSDKPIPIKIIHFLLISIVFTIPLFFTRQFVFSFTQGKTFLFYLLVEVAAAVWLYTVLYQKRYLPSKHPILISGGIFLLLYTLAGLFGFNPGISFGSSLSRMSGLILLYHVGIFLLLLVSTVRDEATWNKIFSTVTYSGALVACVSYLIDFGVYTLPVNPLDGSTLGNSSYAGVYLLFAFFSAILLFPKAKPRKKILLGTVVTLIFFSPILFNLSNVTQVFQNPVGLLGSARAASGSLWIGIVVYGLILLGTSSKKYIRNTGRLGSIALLTIVAIFMVTLPFAGSWYGKLLRAPDFGPRIVFWESAMKGIAERPLLGWGPENYFAPFYKHFDPLLITDEYGGGSESNTDKPHNVYLEIAVTGGITTLAAYLIFFYFVFSSLKKAMVTNAASVAQIAALFGLLVGYMLQNSLFFDTITSYVAGSVVFGYAAYLGKPLIKRPYPPIPKKTPWLALGISLGVFFILFYNLFYKPYQQQATMAHIIENATVAERSGAYKELFTLTSHGRTSTMIYLMNKMVAAVSDTADTLTTQQRLVVLEDVHNLREEVESYIGTDPTHYHLVLSFIRLLRLEYALQPSIENRMEILNTAEGYVEHLIKLSPTNPITTWEIEQLSILRSSI